MPIAIVTLFWKVLLWAPIILLNSNQNIPNSSSVSPLWFHHDDRNLDLGKQSRNDSGMYNIDGLSIYEKVPADFLNTDEAKSEDDLEEMNRNRTNGNYDNEQLVAASSSENYTISKSRITHHFYRRSLKRTKACKRYSDKYLYQFLEQSGMLNQWFMAHTVEDAGRNFARSYENFSGTKINYFDFTNFPHADSSQSDAEDINISFTCNSVCQTIIWKLNEALSKERNYTFLPNVTFSDDDQSHKIGVGSMKQRKANCQLEIFIPVGECIAQGTEEFTGHTKLCTTCHGVYMLDKMCFPRFLNAIRCDSSAQTSGCIFDKISTQAHGSCYMRTLTFKVLRNRGSEECQEWYYEYIQVPTSCECELDAESLLLDAVKP
uniref:Uncharacterized protein n=1 Tax=Setaria digitata TaxID=48799 RepID=A0A915PP86_9BILA